MGSCQHCGQMAFAKDVNGWVCPDCLEAGYFEESEDETKEG